MSKIWKYLIYALVAVFAFSWFKIVLDAGKTTEQSLTEKAQSLKEKAADATADLMPGEDEEDEEDDKDFGDGEDDLDEDELDEDEILAEDWDEETETEEDEDLAGVETTAKGEMKNYEKPEAKKASASTATTASAVTTSSNGRFLVIGGSFSSKGNAKTFVNQLEKLGYEDAEIVVFDKAKKYHTVSVARFDSKTDASKLVGALKGKGIQDAYVHKKRG